MPDKRIAEIRARHEKRMTELSDWNISDDRRDSDIAYLLEELERVRNMVIGLQSYYPAGTGMWHNVARKMMLGDD